MWRFQGTSSSAGKSVQNKGRARDHATYCPRGYVREEPRRFTFRARTGETKAVEHGWSGRSDSEEHGGTTLDARTGNVTTTRELADGLRRVFFHERIPVGERFRLINHVALDAVYVDDGGFDFASMAVVLPRHAGRLRAALGDSRFVNQAGCVGGGVLFRDDALAICPREVVRPHWMLSKSLCNVLGGSPTRCARATTFMRDSADDRPWTYGSANRRPDLLAKHSLIEPSSLDNQRPGNEISCSVSLTTLRGFLAKL